MVERESNLKIILGDNCTHPVKGFGSIKFHLDSGDSILLHDVMYVSGLKKNLASIFALEDKGMRVAFIKGKVLGLLDPICELPSHKDLDLKDTVESLEDLF